MLEPAEARRLAAEMNLPDVLADLNVFRLLLRLPPLAKGVADLLLALMGGTELARGLRELIIMRVAWLTGSGYEWAQHWRIAIGAGVAESDLEAVRDWRTHDFGASEMAVLFATDEAGGVGCVSPATMGRLRALLGEGAALEAVSVAAAWTMLSTLLRTYRVPLEDGLDPWPPDGLAPEGLAPEGSA